MRENALEEVAQKGIRRVATGNPNNLGRGIMHQYQINKVLIFTHNCGVSCAGSVKHIQVVRITKTQRNQRLCLNGKCLGHPWGQLRGELSVNPQNQETTMGWLIRPLANFRQA